MATVRSMAVTDEFAIDEVDNEDDNGDDNEEDDTAASMSCGVSRCPQASTVWPSQVRLKQHRFGFVQI